MAKLRTASIFAAKLDAELSWRKHDIAALSSLLDQSKGKKKEAVVRALIALTYAHWEGFCKAALIYYGSHITLQGKTYGLLGRPLSGLRAAESVQTLSAIKRKIFTAGKVLDQLYDIEQQKATIDLSERLAKIGNLNSELLLELISFYDIDSSYYATKSVLIDESLLKRRNTIAHGDYLDLTDIDAKDLARNVLAVLDRLKDDLTEAATLKSYLRKAAA